MSVRGEDRGRETIVGGVIGRHECDRTAICRM